MSKRIEEELAEMNRLKRLELEFLFFQAKMDNATFKKYRDSLANESNTLQHIDSELQYA